MLAFSPFSEMMCLPLLTQLLKYFRLRYDVAVIACAQVLLTSCSLLPVVGDRSGDADAQDIAAA